MHYKAGASKESRLADYEKIISLYPGSPEAEESRFRIAHLQLRDPPDFDKALAGFDYLAKNASDAKWRAEAYVEIGLTLLQRYFNQHKRNPDDLAQAMGIFSSARAKYPEQAEAVVRAELRQARYYLYTEQDSGKARNALNNILSAFPETSWTTEIRYQLAYCSFAEKKYDECVQLCEAILRERPVSDWNSYLQYFIGTCYLQVGDEASAKTAFQKTVQTYPGTNWARIASSALGLLNEEGGE